MPPPPKRERFNAKARGSVAGGSHKKRKRPPANQVFTPADAEEPLDKDSPQQEPSLPDISDLPEGLDAERGRMSAKKRKRLDSYITKKLKSEQRLKTMQLLASLAPSADTSANLVSISSLGQFPEKGLTAMEKEGWKEDRVVRRGIETMKRRYGDGIGSDLGSDSGAESSAITQDKAGRKAKDGSNGFDTRVQQDHSTPLALVSSKTKSKRSKKASWNPDLLPTAPQSNSSFDSSEAPIDSGSETEGLRSSMSPKALAEKQIAQSANQLSLSSAPAARTERVLPVGPGDALRREENGVTVQPRVEKKITRMPLGRSRRRLSRDADAKNGESSEGSDRDSTFEQGAEEENGSEASVPVEPSEVAENDETRLDSAVEKKQPPTVRKRGLGFKAWAQQQIKQSSATPTDRPSSFSKPSKREHATQPGLRNEMTSESQGISPFGPLGAHLVIPSSSLLDNTGHSNARPSISRSQVINEARMQLPILAEEQAIVEAIRMNPVVVVCGETGSGKTTQVPQMLYEAGFGFHGSSDPGMIAVTQPRRVAAVSLSGRVKSELALPPASSVVAHQIRYSSSTSKDTCIKFMTDGVLLRELSADFLLSRYSVVIVDEAHERGVNTDVLIGVLSRIAKLREAKWRNGGETKPLRIVIMSATLRIEDFAGNTTLFAKSPPVIQIAARQHPVIIHFSKRTTGDYIDEVYRKVSKIHARLPPGGILVFMTGQSEIQAICRKLEKRYGKKHRGDNLEIRSETNVLPPEEQEAEEVELGQQDDLAADVDEGEAEDDPEALDTDDDDTFDLIEETDAPMHILPLYSLLSNEQQMQVFRPPPPGHRLVIISTNVAETSLTIPGIRYVIDTGRAKERHFDVSTGVQSFGVSWISKASASQRAGRAGRTGPGHCYRLYSSALYEDHFAQFSVPEILRMPIEGVVLQMKSMGIDAVINFPFPTPPDRGALRKAEELLTNLGALDRPSNTRMVDGVQQTGLVGGRTTDLGRAMAAFPVTPRFAKMLVIGRQYGCLPYIIAIVAGLSAGDPFIHEQSLDLGDEDDLDDENGPAELRHLTNEAAREKVERKEIRRRYFQSQSQFSSLGKGSSDLFKLLAAIGAYEFDPTLTFCSRHFLRLKAMQEIQQLRSQLSIIAKDALTPLAPPSDKQLKVIRQILTAGFIDHLAVRLDLVFKSPKTYSSTRNVPYRTLSTGTEEIFIHPSSALFHSPPPDFVVYTDVTRTERKTWIKGLTTINPAWLGSLAKGMLSYSKPVEVGVRDRKVSEREREVMLVPHLGRLGVDLPAVKMRQKREGTRWVLVE